MKQYYHYQFSDFLSDASFRQWIKGGRPADHPYWPRVPLLYPDKAEVFYQAAEVLEELFDTGNPIPADELNVEIRRILNTTAGFDESRPLLPGSRSVFRNYWVAAATLIAGLAAWLLMPQTTPELETYQELRQSESPTLFQRSNSSSSIETISLPDGSIAHLYSGASLKYRLKETSQGSDSVNFREVYMSGDIFFDVAKDPNRPFIVYTEGIITKVIGTSFLIRSSDGNASVEVRSGKVMVRPLTGAASEEIALTPNQKVTFHPNVKQLEKDLTSAPELLPDDRNHATFDFENTPLPEVFRILEKAYGVPIRFDASALDGCSLSVKMDDEPFYSKLNIITKTIEATFEIVDGEVIIVGKGCP